MQGLQGGNTAQISRQAARQPVVGEVQDLQAGQRAQANWDTARELVVGEIQGLQTCEPAQGGRDAACQCLATDIQLQPDHPLRGPVNGYPLPCVYAAVLTPVQAHGGTDASLQGGLDGQELYAVSDQVGIGRGVGYDSAIGTCGSLCRATAAAATTTATTTTATTATTTTTAATTTIVARRWWA